VTVESWQLIQRQNLPLDAKIKLSLKRIREWYEHFNGQVYVSFSGGKDSTVLLHLVRSIYPDVPALFVDTGLEFPEIKDFVNSIENVVTVRPKYSFKAIIEKFGYPVISKNVAMSVSRYRNTEDPLVKEYRKYGTKNGKKIGSVGVIPKKWRFLIDAPFPISEYCCKYLKKNPAHEYGKKSGRVAFIGTMASDSENRKTDYMKRGCNAFDNNIPQSRPLGFWNTSDVWEYLDLHKVPYSKIYDMGYGRTGCIFCMFGIHMESKPNRFQKMAITHPKLYNYCINKLGIGEVLDYLHIDYTIQPEIDDFRTDVNVNCDLCNNPMTWWPNPFGGVLECQNPGCSNIVEVKRNQFDYIRRSFQTDCKKPVTSEILNLHSTQIEQFSSEVE
jgi:3'-phosphoadenosine 5'-phosphosulfate sulfotransferase (PAPS reductase)/FAD synthetase